MILSRIDYAFVDTLLNPISVLTSLLGFLLIDIGLDTAIAILSSPCFCCILVVHAINFARYILLVFLPVSSPDPSVFWVKAGNVSHLCDYPSFPLSVNDVEINLLSIV